MPVLLSVNVDGADSLGEMASLQSMGGETGYARRRRTGGGVGASGLSEAASFVGEALASRAEDGGGDGGMPSVSQR